MDPTRFTEYKTGTLIPITVGTNQDYAFVPQQLSVASSMNVRLWPLVTEAQGKLSKLDGLGSALPSPSLLLRPLQRREALTSNSLEGTFVTPKELLLFEGEQTSRTGSRRDDWWEVMNYDEALQRGCDAISKGRPLNCHLLRELHRILLAGVRGRDKSPGEFRDSQVFIGSDRRYIPPPPSEMRGAIEQWEAYLAANDDTHPLVRAYMAHYQFEAIHPFKDGNGRIGRLWLSITLYKWLGLGRPLLYMSEFFEKHRREYIDRLFAVSTNGDWDDWIEFCLRGTIDQSENSIRRCDELRKKKHEYQDSAGHLSPRMNALIERLFDNPFVDVGAVQRQFNVTYPTARSDIDRLIDAGILEEIENCHPKTFVAREIFRAAYGE